jgi:hypothetical protein
MRSPFPEEHTPRRLVLRLRQTHVSKNYQSLSILACLRPLPVVMRRNPDCNRTLKLFPSCEQPGWLSSCLKHIKHQCRSVAVRREARNRIAASVSWTSKNALGTGNAVQVAMVSKHMAQVLEDDVLQFDDQHPIVDAPPAAAFRPASLRRSSMGPRLRISRSPASPRRCRVPGPSRLRGQVRRRAQ